MPTHDPITERILRWRYAGLPTRVGQSLLIGLLCWLSNGEVVVVPWMAVSILTAILDGRASKIQLERPADRRLRLITGATRVASSFAFALVCFIFALGSPVGALSSAMVVGCATVLNNAIMSRGSRQFTLTLVGPSALVLIATPAPRAPTGPRAPSWRPSATKSALPSTACSAWPRRCGSTP